MFLRRVLPAFSGLAACALASAPRTWLDAPATEAPPLPLDAREAVDVIPGQLMVFSGRANVPLARDVSSHLGVPLGNCEVQRFADGEIRVRVLEDVRGQDVYVIQSTCAPVNETLMELLLMVSAMRRSSVARVTAVVPYYGYKRDTAGNDYTSLDEDNLDEEKWDEEDGGDFGGGMQESAGPIGAACVARMLEAVGVDRVISIELQHLGDGKSEGFFSTVRVDSLEVTDMLLTYVHYRGLGVFRDVVIVAPNERGIKKARLLRELMQERLDADAARAGREPFQVRMAVAVQRSEVRVGQDSGLSADGANAGPEVDVIGDVAGADVLLVDDMVDTAGTLTSVVEKLHASGAKRTFAFATHGLLSGPAVHRISASSLEELVVTNSVPLPPVTSPKIVQISLGATLADVIRRLHEDEDLTQYKLHTTGKSEPQEPRY